MNEITIKLSGDDKALLIGLFSAVKDLTAAVQALNTYPATLETAEPEQTLETPTEPPSAPTEPSEETTPGNNTPEPEKPVESRTEPSSEPQYTKADVQSRVVALCANPDHKKAVKRIITEYAPKVSEIPEDKYPEVIAKLELLAMEG